MSKSSQNDSGSRRQAAPSGTPKVSVIVPVYNAEKYLEESVRSLLGQSLRDIEVILADDGSTDSSPEICRVLCASDARVRTFSKPNSGAGLTRTAALPLARGEYLAFLDSDDLLHPRALETMYNQANEHRLDVLRASRVQFAEGGKMPEPSLGHQLEVVTDPSLIARIALTFIGPASADDVPLRLEGGVWSGLYRREMIEREGIVFVSEREFGTEDYLFNFEAVSHAVRFGYTADEHLLYRLTAGSVSRTVREDALERQQLFCERIERWLTDRGIDSRRAALAPMCFFLEMARAYFKFRMLGPGPLSQSLEWCRRQCRLPYFSRISAQYPCELLGRVHRLHLSLMAAGHVRLLYLLTRLQNALRH